jgi:hypothetical protein
MTDTRATKKRLRSGFTTGTAAAAAAKAALRVLAGESVAIGGFDPAVDRRLAGNKRSYMCGPESMKMETLACRVRL